MSWRAELLLVLAVLAAGCATREDSGPGGTGAALAVVALVGGRVQPAPDAAAVEDGVVLVEGRAIIAVGPRTAPALP